MNWKIYIVNLETAVIRRNFMLKQLKKRGIDNYEFIDAINATKVTSDWLQSQVDKKELVRPLSGGEISCTLSHKKALENFLNNKELEYAVILEDDAILPPDFIKSVEDGIKYLGQTDILMLAASVHEPAEFTSVYSIGNNRTILKPVNPYPRVFTTAAYIMPRMVAERHIKSFYPITDVTDSWAHYKKRGSMDTIYITYPFVVDQEVFQSSRGAGSFKNDIINRLLYYNIPILAPFFRKRRMAIEKERMKNIHIVQ